VLGERIDSRLRRSEWRQTVDAREIVVDVAGPEEYSQLAMSSASS
jgi:hypothetical protein